MKNSIRRLFQAIPISRKLYGMARREYQYRRLSWVASPYFKNMKDYREALRIEDGKIVDIHGPHGLVFSIRRNYMDAVILAEVFVDDCYIRGLSFPERPVIIDIGGYIGDFALYAVKHINALKVISCEPSPHNWALLQKNVAQNNLGDRIKTINKAVTDGRDIMMNVDAPPRGQARVSAYGFNDQPKKLVRGITLDALIAEHDLTRIDLVKIDCEGGEYDILLQAPSETLKRIHNIVFEYHAIEGFQDKLEAVNQRLRREGYTLNTRGDITSASRVS